MIDDCTCYACPKLKWHEGPCEEAEPSPTAERVVEAAPRRKWRLSESQFLYCTDAELQDTLIAMESAIQRDQASSVRMAKLVEAADYLQHCRRREIQATAIGRSATAKLSVTRASDQYDFLREQLGQL